MKTLTQSMSVALLGMSLAIPLTACDSNAEPGAAPVLVSRASPPKCYDCGTISNVQKRTDEAKPSGLGIVIGAVAGAVVGHQVGDGRGQDAATVVGAVGGGIAGNEIEKHVRGTPYFHVSVTMDNGGGTRTINVGSMQGLANGSRVKIVGNNLQPIG
jgi:outer membrane lipoprotein SlyB